MAKEDCGKYIGIAMAFGAAGGVLLGSLLDNFGLGIPIGVAMGLLGGMILSSAAGRKEKE